MEFLFQPPKRAIVTHKLNVRSEPRADAVRVGRLELNTTVSVDRWTTGAPFLGNDRWFKLKDLQEFVWSGGVSLIDAPLPQPASAPATTLQVNRRNNAEQSILPLRVVDLNRIFGDVGNQPGSPPGAIVVPPAWKANLEKLDHSVLKSIHPGELLVHKKAMASFKAVFDEIANKGLSDRLRSCGGTWVPRHIGWNVQKALSSHTWGVAIDLNERWNGYNAVPAFPGEVGSVRELVPIFASQGFAWGGHFSTPDGMHFELARLDLPDIP